MKIKNNTAFQVFAISITLLFMLFVLILKEKHKAQPHFDSSFDTLHSQIKTIK